MAYKYLIAGLPASGKTTYVAALWTLIKNYNLDCAFSCVELPDDSSYLDEIASSWLQLEDIQRTARRDVDSLSFKISKNESDVGELVVPDFMGEMFRDELSGNPHPELQTWFRDCAGMMVLLRLERVEYFQEEFNSNCQINSEIKEKTFGLESMSQLGQCLLLLQYLRENIGDKPISICISACDLIDFEKRDIETWLQKKFPLLLNYIKSHFSQYNLFGLCAQGGKYDNDTKGTLIKATRNHQRAYVYTNKKQYDITLPLSSLMQM